MRGGQHPLSPRVVHGSNVFINLWPFPGSRPHKLLHDMNFYCTSLHTSVSLFHPRQVPQVPHFSCLYLSTCPPRPATFKEKTKSLPSYTQLPSLFQVFLLIPVNTIPKLAYLTHCNYYCTHLCNKRSVLYCMTYLSHYSDGLGSKTEKPHGAQYYQLSKIYAESW